MRKRQHHARRHQDETTRRLRTPEPASLVKRLAAAGVSLPDGVEIVEVDALPKPELSIVGGTPASTCTWGFTVRHGNGDVGIATAAHCGNAQAYAGFGLPFRAEDRQGNQDVQWHSACDIFGVSNQFDSGVGLRTCTGIRGRPQQAINSIVCKNGWTTGYTCGLIQSISYAPSWVTSPQATFVYVDGDFVGTNLSEPGDSGGPWFYGELAYGIHSGGGDNDSIYMPIDYISSLGLSVLTFVPPSNCIICGDGVCEGTGDCWIDCTECGNGECESGEVCSLDCAECGDSVCEPGERCRFDCGFCGDGTCQSGEQDCPADCEGCDGGPCLPE